ncbi:phosphoenolpyruvate carboxykinase [ATP] [Candidatus Liberibacter asiaticus]|uniref:Phosphoenolpyruvate carboxykinase (ATP) n=1 Tax=Candidatus Liberibacter asiaticus str. gxpsy TaxID=1174529 RepID=A0ABN4AZS4_LIBAS|nr:phosphoenolpyruvate carboxykinase (ATP) [Candidatus Liberibacter asiaticus]AGH16734.1 phosphoenolpyruvate carboxykinase [Candidatus Liberibacter asiaticus str. gxpsy]ASK52582.1 phosphoenolpyruvate carboxykinase (ATP) [Candidatus Liberibacter asiaticus]KAE9515632.1 Phosphoenolpyruvate carboxykinase (ATP) [Candidatus Liberibacter asiaticus]KAE9516667.1 Phosphoenolpyruvate carboxykinase (ATP) [Candidatus Liberibacter asiaticus]KIH95684.1 phosphoenolpyruvate carboxykinase [ATP] [Candidatus Libe
MEKFDLEGSSRVYRNLSTSRLYEESIRREKTILTCDGALRALTGQHTGRSAFDKFIVRDSHTENDVFWENNKYISPADFDTLKADMLDYIKDKDLFLQDLVACPHTKNAISVCVVTQYAWHSLFIRNLLKHKEDLGAVPNMMSLQVVVLPDFSADPNRHGCCSETIIAVDLTSGLILIGGTSYAGEIKKSVFTYLNHIFPERGIMPMHCSINMDKEKEDVALFFGLSGTGKTTLSASVDRFLIGDDEHGWSKEGVFNFEGGCYAKSINLSKETEPEIFSASCRFGTVLENVVVDECGIPNFKDSSVTENTRAAYPLNFIHNHAPQSIGKHPKHVIMLAADAFGVLPPVAYLNPEKAVYYFLSGYTAKVAGTEKGVLKPEATFSACFGAPFMPRDPVQYGNILKDYIVKYCVDCWLVNTGWTAGSYGEGYRMPLSVTRALLKAIFDNSIKSVPYRVDENFGFSVPLEVKGVDRKLLNPRDSWNDVEAYDQKMRELLLMFENNAEKKQIKI